MKGIILAGGSGSRLNPLTNTISKQILPVYDKPMIYYPLSTLMNLRIKDILIISTERDTPAIKKLLQDGSELGLNISYDIQHRPNGIAESFVIGEKFIGDDSVCLVLGDNIFYGSELVERDLGDKFKTALNLKEGAYILAYRVSDPERYGVIELDSDDNSRAISIEEKPIRPKSNWAATGLYFYDNDVVNIAKNLKPSARGELEITDINKEYLSRKNLNVIRMGRGFAWLDAGTPDSLIDSATFVQTIEKRQGIKVACIEEIAYLNGFINSEQLEKIAGKFKSNNSYGNYLRKVLQENYK